MGARGVGGGQGGKGGALDGVAGDGDLEVAEQFVP